MSAWDYKPLSNAAALEWIRGFNEETGLAAIKKTLSLTSKVSKRSRQGCDRMVAAAEMVAAVRGHPGRDFPTDVREWIGTLGAKASEELTHLNLTAIDFIRLLMAESATATEMVDADLSQLWKAELKHLIDRLKSPVVSGERRLPRMVAGDVFSIPLPAGHRAFCQLLVAEPKRHGYLVLVSRHVAPTERTNLEAIGSSTPLFPPVFVNLKDICESRRWQKVGKLPLKPFQYPRFRVRSKGPSRNAFTFDWQIFDGTSLRPTPLGILWPGQWKLEFLTPRTAEEVEERIARTLRKLRHLP